MSFAALHGVLFGCFTLRGSTPSCALAYSPLCYSLTATGRPRPVAMSPCSLRSSMALPPCRRVRITPLPRVPPSAVNPHRHPARTARFVADASGLAALDLMHAPQSSPAFSLRSGVSMLTAPRHTRPLRPSCHGGTGFTGTSPCPGQTSLRSVAQGEACGRAIDPVVRPSAIGHQVGHRPFPATLVGTPPALTAWCNCTNGEVHLRIAPLVKT